MLKGMHLEPYAGCVSSYNKQSCLLHGFKDRGRALHFKGSLYSRGLYPLKEILWNEANMFVRPLPVAYLEGCLGCSSTPLCSYTISNQHRKQTTYYISCIYPNRPVLVGTLTEIRRCCVPQSRSDSFLSRLANNVNELVKNDPMEPHPAIKTQLRRDAATIKSWIKHR